MSTARKFFSIGNIAKHYEIIPLVGVLSSACSFAVGMGAWAFYAKTDVEWNRWTPTPRYLDFAADTRRSQLYWPDKPTDTAPEIIKKLRVELAMPPEYGSDESKRH